MRAFIAIDLPEEIKSNILELDKTIPKHNLTFVGDSALHITIHFFADISDVQASKVIDIINGTSPGKFKVALTGISYFGGDDIRVVFAKIDDPSGRISRLYEDMGSKFTNEKISFDRKRSFVPHATIARCRGGTARLMKFIEQHSEYDLGEFEVTKISFMKSDQTQGGHVYTTLLEHEI